MYHDARLHAPRGYVPGRPAKELRFVRGVMFAVPASLALWTIILALIV